MKQPLLRFCLFNSSILFYLLSSHPTTAQIVPDATLPVNSSVTQQGNINVIEGGTTAGRNLFHSFKDFSVPNGAEAFFNNALEIQNIFSRVTGGNISNIDGLIRANGVANLFLINPNGIIFGPNAKLNIGGSFFASTASSIRFADGMEFSATNPNAPPLLTINVPIGLQYGKNAGNIQIQGKGQEIASNGATESFKSSLNPLEVLPGKTLAIAGGNIIIDGGILQAPGGRVELGAVAGEGTIGINADGSLSFPDGVARADVSIINKAGINVLAAGGGSIAIAARNIDISGESLLTGGIATGKGTSDSMAGDISLGATEAITIDSSRIENNVNPDAIGNSGSINIKGGSLSLTNNARLDASTFGQGKAGSITINARDTVSFNGSGAYTSVKSNANGDAGNINITTGSLSVKNGARLSATIAGEGKGGNVNIIASGSVSFDGVNGLPTAALTNVEVGGTGNAGDVNITSASLEVTNGALLESRTRGTGKGGNVTINTSNTVLFDGQGNQSSFGPSGAYTSVESTANGNGGDINITTGSLSVKNGARLSATIAGEGKGGNVNIIASDRVSFDGVNGLPTAALTNVETTGIGNAGDVNIKAASLEVTNGALLESRTRGTGKGGNVTINTSNTVLFDGQGNQSSFGPSGAYTSVESTANGNGGDINITTGSLSVKNGARLSASASGQEASGNGGNITINATTFSLDDGANLTATNEGSGLAGNIVIKAGNQVSVRNSSITSTSNNDDENSGFNDIKITAPEGAIFLNQATISTTNSGAGLAGDIVLNASKQIAIADSKISSDGNFGRIFIGSQPETEMGDEMGESFLPALVTLNQATISTTNSGAGDAGDIVLNASKQIAIADSKISSNGNFGQIFIGSQPDPEMGESFPPVLVTLNQATISTTNSGAGDAGDIVINASQQIAIAADSTISSDGNFGRIFIGSKPETERGESFFPALVTIEGINTELTTDNRPAPDTDAGSINIKAGQLIINDAELSSSTFGAGNAGDISVNVNGSVSFTNNAFFTNVKAGATGKGGDITIKAGSLSLTNGAQLQTSVIGSTDENTEGGRGNAGNVTIDVRDGVTISGSNQNNESSAIFSDVEAGASGNGGNITINARTFSLDDGASLTATNEGSGLAGNIAINAPNQVSVRNSSITSTSNNNDRNEYNGIYITASEGSIVLKQATISTTNSGSGFAGDIVLSARDNVSISNQSTIASDGYLGRIFIGKNEVYPETLSPGSVTIDNSNLSTTNAESDGDVAIDAGNISIEATGSISLVNKSSINTFTRRLGDAGSVTLRVENGEISLDNSDIFSTVEAEGIGNGGNISITARSLSATDGAQIQTGINSQEEDPTGERTAGNISINASEDVFFAGFTNTDIAGNIGFFPSGVRSEVEKEAIGNAGSIDITARSLFLTDQAAITTNNFSSGLGGNIAINAVNQVSVRNSSITSTSNNNDRTDFSGINITASEGSIFLNQATISTTNFGSGFAGDIVLSARNNVSISNQSTIASDGYLGRILVGRNEVYQETLSPGSVTIDNSKLSTTNAKSDGDVAIDAGEISIEATGSISLANRSEINAATARLGDAGSVTLRVENGEISLANGSSIFSTVEPGGEGDGGEIFIETGSLFLRDGAELQTLVRGPSNDPPLPGGKGDAGIVSIEASKDVFFTGFATIDLAGNRGTFPSGVFSTVQLGGEGKGGNININARSLSLTNRATVSVTSRGSQGAGSIDINARYVRLNNGTLSAETTAGDRGNISVRSSALILRRESRISTNATGSATGGNINIDTDVLAALENSDITANSRDSLGGQVIINAQSVFGTQFRTALTPESDITATGGTPEQSGTVQINTPDVDPSSGLIELPANVVDVTGLVVDPCSAARGGSRFSVTGRGGIPESPDEPLSPDAFLVDLVTIDPKAQGSRGAGEQRGRGAEEQRNIGEIRSNNVNSDTDKSDAPVAEIVEATGWYTNEKGEVVLTASTPTRYPVWRTQPMCK